MTSDDQDVVRTTGRRMSRQLQDALDGMYGNDRRAAREVFESHAPDTPLRRLLRAVALELRLGDIRTTATIHRLEREHDADLPDGPPPPRPAGGVYHPESGDTP